GSRVRQPGGQVYPEDKVPDAEDDGEGRAGPVTFVVVLLRKERIACPNSIETRLTSGSSDVRGAVARFCCCRARSLNTAARTAKPSSFFPSGTCWLATFWDLF